MPRRPESFTAVVATANELRSGAVVFRTAEGDWSHEIAAAAVAEDPGEAEALLARAQDDQRACRVVEPALIEVVRVDGRISPASLRERIRAAGPTVVPPPFGCVA